MNGRFEPAERDQYVTNEGHEPKLVFGMVAPVGIEDVQPAFEAGATSSDEGVRVSRAFGFGSKCIPPGYLRRYGQFATPLTMEYLRRATRGIGFNQTLSWRRVFCEPAPGLSLIIRRHSVNAGIGELT